MLNDDQRKATLAEAESRGGGGIILRGESDIISPHVARLAGLLVFVDGLLNKIDEPGVKYDYFISGESFLFHRRLPRGTLVTWVPTDEGAE